MKARNITTAIITSGPSQLAECVQDELGINYVFSNKLIIKNDKIAGFEPVAGRDRKQIIIKDLCKKLNIDLKDATVVIHDWNDLKLAKVAGNTIALNPTDKEIIKYSNHIIQRHKFCLKIYVSKYISSINCVLYYNNLTHFFNSA